MKRKWRVFQYICERILWRKDERMNVTRTMGRVSYAEKMSRRRNENMENASNTLNMDPLPPLFSVALVG